jgi:prepilin-type N-terminal cleavage/methylation domain-containing protein
MKTTTSRFRRMGFTLVELLVVMAIIAILAALLMPSLGRAKAKTRNITCVSQLRQLGIAVRLYAEDNDSTLPVVEMMPSAPLNPQFPFRRICDVLGLELGKARGDTNSPAVFKCPADRAGFFETEGSSYGWNWELSGRRIDDKNTTPANRGNAQRLMVEFDTAPVLFDYDDFHARPPQTGRNAVYGDGHVDKFSVPLPASPF